MHFRGISKLAQATNKSKLCVEDKMEPIMEEVICWRCCKELEFGYLLVWLSIAKAIKKYYFYISASASFTD